MAPKSCAKASCGLCKSHPVHVLAIGLEGAHAYIVRRETWRHVE